MYINYCTYTADQFIKHLKLAVVNNVSHCIACSYSILKKINNIFTITCLVMNASLYLERQIFTLLNLIQRTISCASYSKMLKGPISCHSKISIVTYSLTLTHTRMCTCACVCVTMFNPEVRCLVHKSLEEGDPVCERNHFSPTPMQNEKIILVGWVSVRKWVCF